MLILYSDSFRNSLTGWGGGGGLREGVPQLASAGTEPQWESVAKPPKAENQHVKRVLIIPYLEA